MAVLLQLVAIAFFGIVAWYGGVLMVSESGQTTPALGISMTWVYLMYPVMGAVVMIHLLDGLWVILKGR
jgi:TRAP-type C4-dicarboxylate transport system permease small subunit